MKRNIECDQIRVLRVHSQRDESQSYFNIRTSSTNILFGKNISTNGYGFLYIYHTYVYINACIVIDCFVCLSPFVNTVYPTMGVIWTFYCKQIDLLLFPVKIEVPLNEAANIWLLTGVESDIYRCQFYSHFGSKTEHKNNRNNVLTGPPHSLCSFYFDMVVTYA